MKLQHLKQQKEETVDLVAQVYKKKGEELTSPFVILLGNDIRVYTKVVKQAIAA